MDVVIPCWGSYVTSLEASIRSASGATNIIVVGDRAAAAVAESAGARTVALTEPATIGRARHEGMLASNADAVCFLDADDRLLPGALTLMASWLERDPRAVAVGGKMVRRGTTGSWPPAGRARLACTRWGAVVLLWHNSLPTVGSCVIRRQAVGSARLFPELLDEDWHAAVTVRALGPYRFLDLDLLDYSIDEGSLSRRARDQDALARSQDQLLSTARRSLRSGYSWWRVANCFAAPVRRSRRHDMVRRWSHVGPR